MSGRGLTVLGLIDAFGVGPTLLHLHERLPRPGVDRSALEELAGSAATGGRTSCDVSVVGLGRDPAITTDTPARILALAVAE